MPTPRGSRPAGAGRASGVGEHWHPLHDTYNTPGVLVMIQPQGCIHKLIETCRISEPRCGLLSANIGGVEPMLGRFARKQSVSKSDQPWPNSATEFARFGPALADVDQTCAVVGPTRPIRPNVGRVPPMLVELGHELVNFDPIRRKGRRGARTRKERR